MDGVAEFHAALPKAARGPVKELTKLKPWRSFLAIFIDWALIISSMFVALTFGGVWFIVATFIIGVCQRALGNLLHDGAHHLLTSNRYNDLFARLLIGWVNLQELSAYRRAHLAHHRHLSETDKDPDLLCLTEPTTAAQVFRQALADKTLLRSNFIGNITSPWVWVPWVIVISGAFLAFGPRFAISGLIVWLAARVFVFHPITVFRELADHYGGEMTNVIEYSRNAPTTGMLRFVLHPHANGYHTIHHLMPGVPYYRLPQADKLLSEIMPNLYVCTCRSYFGAENSIVASWIGSQARQKQNA